MRIIAGSLGGRHFDASKVRRVHPMSDKVRGALFNSLGDIQGLTVLDAFAGSGALSFEALSRGARKALAVENDKKAFTAIKEAAEELGLSEKCKIVRTNVSGWSDNNPDVQFDIIIADPPYDKLQLPLIQKLVRHLAPAGTFVLSLPGKVSAPELDGLTTTKQKSYGDAQLVFYALSGTSVANHASVTD